MRTQNSEALLTSSQQPWNLLGEGILAAAHYGTGCFLVETDLARADLAGFGARGGGAPLANSGFCSF